jgi:hypothetical protein
MSRSLFTDLITLQAIVTAVENRLFWPIRTPRYAEASQAVGLPAWLSDSGMAGWDYCLPGHPAGQPNGPTHGAAGMRVCLWCSAQTGLGVRARGISRNVSYVLKGWLIARGNDRRLVVGAEVAFLAQSRGSPCPPHI